jgi:glycosyltransferase involved in cell wall biosynthesis
VEVVPILFDAARYGENGANGGTGPPSVVSVGRIAPNKRHDLVLAAFEGFRARHAADATLTVIGEPITPAFGELIAGLAGPGVTFTGPISQPAVNDAYRGAAVLLHLSEHEGFCIPLLEGFHFGVAVVARAAGAMPEVGGDAVLWADDPAVAAELMAMAVEDGELRAELQRRGRTRLEELSPERTGARVLKAVEESLR